MKPLLNEKSIFKSKDEVLEVTNFRIRKIQKKRSQTEISFILISNLSSSRLKSTDPKALLYLGILFCFSGVVGLAAGPVGVAPLGVGILLLLAYFLARGQSLEFIGFGGEKIEYPTKMGVESALQILEKIESAQFDSGRTALDQSA